MTDHKTEHDIDIRDHYKNANIASLLQGNLANANRYEKELEEIAAQIEVREMAKESWDMFKYNSFNLTSIYRYSSQ